MKGSRIQYISHEWALVSARSTQSIVNLISAACCSWRRAVSRPNGEMVQLHDYVKCSYPHLRRHWSSEEVITMWRMPTCDIITCHCSNLGQGTNVGYIFKENYSDNKCSMSECIKTILYFNVISPEKGKGHTFTFVSECATALLRTQQPGDQWPDPNHAVFKTKLFQHGSVYETKSQNIWRMDTVQ